MGLRLDEYGGRQRMLAPTNRIASVSARQPPAIEKPGHRHHHSVRLRVAPMLRLT
jgi:hypothetical protein